MEEKIIQKIRAAEEELNVHIPGRIAEFISSFTGPIVYLGQEQWYFFVVDEAIEGKENNSVLEDSVSFREEWGIAGVVIAANGIGDYLLLLPGANNQLADSVYILLHETAEIKRFAKNIEALKTYGPDDYRWNDGFYYRIDEQGRVVNAGMDELPPDKLEHNETEIFDEYYKRRNELDDLIDSGNTSKATEILEGLEFLAYDDNQRYKAWALNKLSDLYLRGFGPIPQNLVIALQYNSEALLLNDAKAHSNRAACYFFGIGMEKDLQKALSFATTANELSKKNMFAGALATKSGGGMFDDMVEMIQSEMEKSE